MGGHTWLEIFEGEKAAGMSADEIANKHGFSRDTVWRSLKQNVSPKHR
jgi:DNA-binding phage protein